MEMASGRRPFECVGRSAIIERNNIMLLPLEEHLWVSTRLSYLALAAESIPGILVDGRDSIYISALPEVEDAAWEDLLGKFNDRNTKAGALSAGCEDANDWCVALYANLKSAYRKDVASSRKIRGLP